MSSVWVSYVFLYINFKGFVSQKEKNTFYIYIFKTKIIYLLKNNVQLFSLQCHATTYFETEDEFHPGYLSETYKCSLLLELYEFLGLSY